MTPAAKIHAPTSAAPGRVCAAVGAFVEGLGDTLNDHTMGAQQINLLLVLYVHGELNQHDLPRFTHVQKSANGRNIERLGLGSYRQTGLGLLESYEEPTNRRFKMVRLTPKGRAILEDVARKVTPYFIINPAVH